MAITIVNPDQTRRSTQRIPLSAGRLTVEVMTWMVPTGSVLFESVGPPRSMAEADED